MARCAPLNRTWTAEVLLEAGAVLAEGPRWDEATQQLLWVDIEAGKVHLGDDTFELGERAGAAALAPDGRLLVALEDRLVMLDIESGDTADLVAIPHEHPRMRTNDGICDAAGRFWIGTMALDESLQHRGALYRYDPDGSLHTELTGISLSNGIGWSPDGTRMYYIDTPSQRVDAIDFDPDTGALHDRRPWVTVPESAGWPDGLAVDHEGGVWVALFGGGAVRRYRPDGELDGVIELPVSQVTSCCFAGERLIITTASRDVHEPQAGHLFVAETGFSGPGAHRFGR
jgi:sugar lactone lactonase YvrE